MNSVLHSLLAAFAFGTCFAQSPHNDAAFADRYPDYLFEVTKVMVHDIINPPAAARYYAYTALASHLVADPESTSWTGIRVPQVDGEVQANLAATYALLEVARRMIPSGQDLEPVQEQLLAVAKSDFKIKKKQIASSISYAKLVADEVVAYSLNDGYRNLSARVAYTPKKGPGYWYPTPPAYIEAIEPHWTTIRPFFLDSSTQFVPEKPVPFDMDTSSVFYKEQLMGVYDAVKNRTREEEEIAKFWDCNPFEVKIMGHTMIGMKKITPGGHWMGITGIATRKTALGFQETVKAHALVAMTLHDAFISCWDEKYRSDRIRPETVINQYLDDEWRPVLQTPPFPEYTSGHSVASGAASTMLTHLFGDDFAFDDDTETYFGLPIRSFPSFDAAAEEAAISRLYGGIHYIDACDIGLRQGRDLGEFIVNKISH